MQRTQRCHKSLHFSSTLCTGKVPASLGQLINLEKLHIGYNELEGKNIATAKPARMFEPEFILTESLIDF